MAQTVQQRAVASDRFAFQHKALLNDSHKPMQRSPGNAVVDS